MVKQFLTKSLIMFTFTRNNKSRDLRDIAAKKEAKGFN